MTVFEKLHEAQTREAGVSLSAADVELLYRLLSEELAKAETEYERWKEIFDELDRMSQ